MSRLCAPKPQEAMFHGLLGDLVRIYGPHTEASPAACVVQNLVLFGNAVGRGPHFVVGETLHHLNENVLVVGTSSKSRKGDSSNVALRPLADADPEWAQNLASGLSSGEGLIHAVRDPVTTRDSDTGEERIVDAGVEDKRLPVLESEFSSVSSFRTLSSAAP